MKNPSEAQIARWRKALFETGTMTLEQHGKVCRMGGGELAKLYNWLAAL